MSEKRRQVLLRFTGGMAYWSYKAVLYFLSFLGPTLVLDHFRSSSAILLLALGISGYGFAGLIFLFLLVLTKRSLIGPVRTVGVYTIHTNEAKKWFSAAALNAIAQESPFRSFTIGLSLVASWYYRGMGAKMPNSVLLGLGVIIFDPYFLEVGENATIGAGAVILGHLGHGQEFLLGRVVIGEGAVIGLRAVICPEVRIGNHSIIAAGAVVVRGTVIPDGETWAGVPARKVVRTS
jgi:acetyltransferase-like isoleucine patch superfamily enzyme